MAATILTVASQPSELDLGVVIPLSITTEAESVTIVAADPAIVETDSVNKTLKGLAKGTSRITITAQYGDKDPTTVSWITEVMIIPGTLTVGQVPSEIALGSKSSVTINTNAEEGFNFQVADSDILRAKKLSNTELELYAIGMGHTSLTITARKNNSKDTLLRKYNIMVSEQVIRPDGSIAVGLRLTNTVTGRTVNVTTSNNTSKEDITVFLPSRSGNLITEEDFKDKVSPVMTPSIIQPVNGITGYFGQFKATPYKTQLGFNGTHDSTIWELSKKKDFVSVSKRFVVSPVSSKDLTETTFYNVPFGTYFVRVRYTSGVTLSLWSEPIQVEIASNADIEDADLPNVTTFYTDENAIYDNSYFGYIPPAKTVDNYHYRGNIMTIRKYYNKQRYYEGVDTGWETHRNGRTHQVIFFYEGETVTYKNKLYRATKDQPIIPKTALGNDHIHIPTWNKLEGLYKYSLMVKYLPLVVQRTKKFVIEIYTDCPEDKLVVESTNKNIFDIEKGITREGMAATNPHGTSSTGAKFFTIVAKNNGWATLRIKCNVDDDQEEDPTYLTRRITVNDTAMNPTQAAPIEIEGYRSTVDPKNPRMDLVFIGNRTACTLGQPDIFCVEESYDENSSIYRNGVYAQTSTVTRAHGNAGNNSLTFSNNGNFYVYIGVPGDGSGYTTYTFFIVRAHGWDNIWVPETRRNLPSWRCLLDKIGIGFDTVDNNYTGLTINGAGVGPLQPDKGWFKYYHKNKLCYIMAGAAIKNSISWCDIAVRDVTYKQRTIRIGGNLYWCRLPYPEEIKTVYGALLDGKYPADPTATASINFETRDIWTLDEKVGARRTTVNIPNTTISLPTVNPETGDSTIRPSRELTENQVDPRSRQGSLVFVLEFMPETMAPYRNLGSAFPNMTPADNEVFQYDPQTDTGYFGLVSENRFITYEGLHTAVAYSGGATQFSGVGHWLKFYWHGQILYIAKRTNRYSLSYNNIKANQVMYGCDMGGSQLKTVTVNAAKYRVCVPMGDRAEPWRYDRDAFGEGGHSSWTLLFNGILTAKRGQTGQACGRGEYSQWCELMSRVASGYAGYTEVNGYEWYSEYMDETTALQIGDNWANFNQRGREWTTYEVGSDPLQVNYDTDGNGTASWGREHGNSSILFLGDRGVLFSYYGIGADSAGAGLGCRSVLALSPAVTN